MSQLEVEDDTGAPSTVKGSTLVALDLIEDSSASKYLVVHNSDTGSQVLVNLATGTTAALDTNADYIPIDGKLTLS